MATKPTAKKPTAKKPAPKRTASKAKATRTPSPSATRWAAAFLRAACEMFDADESDEMAAAALAQRRAEYVAFLAKCGQADARPLDAQFKRKGQYRRRKD